MPSKTPNKTTRAELTPFQRGMIIGAHRCELTPTEISRSLGFSVSTVRTTIEKFATSTTGESKPRSGRPTIFSPQDQRQVIRAVQKDQLRTYREVQSEANMKLSRYAYRRICRSAGLRS